MRPVTMGGMGGMPPGTMSGMPPGTMGGMPPGTMGGMPPGTAARMATGRVPGSRQGTTRQGTAARPIGVGATTDVQVTGRPMTTQGVSGMKTGATGPKRQIYDKTYWMGELRKKCKELEEEVLNLNKEINEIQQDNVLYTSLEKRYDTLVKTVRSLEGDLADHNLATDKQRTDTRPEEVNHTYMIMKQQNDDQRSEVDQIFLEKKRNEEAIDKMKAEIISMARAAEERLNELHPDQRQEYETLREENHRNIGNLADARDELEEISGRLNSFEGRLRSDTLRTRHHQLQGVQKDVSERLGGLEEEMRHCSMSITEQRDILLAKVKADNAEIVQAEKRNQELKVESEKLRAQIREVVADAQERKDEGSDQSKYEILFTKDQEMTQFIDSFDAQKAEEEKKVKEKQQKIVILLENISRALSLAGVSPEAHLRDVEDEIDFKNRQLHNSENTQNRLEAELDKRRGELDKIESLDVKISAELQAVEEKQKQYETEIEEKYDLVDDMKGQGAHQLLQLDSHRKFLTSRHAALKQQVGFLRIRHTSKRQQLTDDETATSLEEMEQKIRQFGQTVYTLKSYITQKSSESNYEAERAACLDMSNQINKILQDACMKM